MIEKTIKLQNQQGLHNRPAIVFVTVANSFKSSIWLEKDNRRVNAKSLLGILSLCIFGGHEVGIISEGNDEEAAVNKLVELIECGFDEPVENT